jgi:hypothetical protein
MIAEEHWPDALPGNELDPAKKQEYDNDNEDQSDSARRRVTPTLAMRPPR